MKFLLQLKMASECGMTIPTTLCSTDAEEVRQFMLKHQRYGVVYKPLYLDQLSLPGIFQKKMEKLYDLHVICIGRYLITDNVLPDDLAIKIRVFMHRLGLAFGRIEFRVTPDHEYIFLDVKDLVSESVLDFKETLRSK